MLYPPAQGKTIFAFQNRLEVSKPLGIVRSVQIERSVHRLLETGSLTLNGIEFDVVLLFNDLPRFQAQIGVGISLGIPLTRLHTGRPPLICQYGAPHRAGRKMECRRMTLFAVLQHHKRHRETMLFERWQTRLAYWCKLG